MCFHFAWHGTCNSRIGIVNAFELYWCRRELLSLHKSDLILSYSDNRVLLVQNLNQNFVKLRADFQHTGAHFAVLVRDVNTLIALQRRRTNAAESWPDDFSLVYLSYVVIVKENSVSVFAGRFAFDCLDNSTVEQSIFPRRTDTHTEEGIFWTSSGG